jgi:hypothetical protein
MANRKAIHLLYDGWKTEVAKAGVSFKFAGPFRKRA